MVSVWSRSRFEPFRASVAALSSSSALIARTCALAWRLALLLVLCALSAPSGVAQGRSGAQNGQQINYSLTLTLNPNPVYQINTSTGTVTLSPAPLNGATVTLSSAATSKATVPASVTIPAGKTSATFTVTPNNTLSAPTTVVISAAYANAMATTTLTINISQPLPSITNFGVTGLAQTSTIDLAWTYPATPPTPCTFYWARSSASHNNNANGMTTATYLLDTSAPLTDSYVYSLHAAPNDPNNLTNGYHYTNSLTSVINVTPVILPVAVNQTIDARYDPRYSVYKYVDHNFGTSAYKGGLYVGVAPQGDNSRAGRSLFRFSPLPAPPAVNPFASNPGGLWPGSLNVYFAGALTTNTLGWTVGAQAIADNGWTLSNLTWDSAPVFDPTQPQATATVTYNTASPQPAWVNWNVPNVFIDAVDAGQSSLCFGVADTTEPTDLIGCVNSWLYFVRKEAVSANAPCLVYATGAPLELINITLTSATVKGGTAVTGTAYLNGIPGAGCPQGVLVTLTSNNACLSGGSTIIINAAKNGFSLTTSTVTSTQTVTLTGTATIAGISGNLPVPISLTVTVTP